MKQQTWIAVILVGAVAINGVAYLVVRARTPASRVAEPPRVASLPRPVPSPPVPAPGEEAPTAAPTPAADAPAEEDNPGLARAHRASGLAALEDRDYDQAVADFTEALRLRKDKGDLVALLRIAEELRARGQTRTARAEPSRTTPGKPRPGRTAPRTQTREEPAARPDEAPRGGLLLVTSTPPGLVVQVDGKARDLTPARLPLASGAYRVALMHGERRLYEETVEVQADSVQSINRDVTAELAPPSAVAPRATPEPVAVAPAPAPAAPPATSTEPAGVRGAVRGDLDVTSPALYGEVWINNRPYGFPPVLARGLPSGPAKVEVRVNGEVKRRMIIEVQPGRSTPVRVR